jgi:hypothetical protein
VISRRSGERRARGRSAVAAPAASAPQPGRDAPVPRAAGRSGSAGPGRPHVRRELAMSTLNRQLTQRNASWPGETLLAAGSGSRWDGRAAAQGRRRRPGRTISKKNKRPAQPGRLGGAPPGTRTPNPRIKSPNPVVSPRSDWCRLVSSPQLSHASLCRRVSGSAGYFRGHRAPIEHRDWQPVLDLRTSWSSGEAADFRSAGRGRAPYGGAIDRLRTGAAEHHAPAEDPRNRPAQRPTCR